MAGGTLNVNEFCVRLAGLYETVKAKKHGSVYLVQKPFLYKQPSSSDDDPMNLDGPMAPVPIIVRATNGKSSAHKADKIKISTIVQPSELPAFFSRIAEIEKAGMATLRRKKKKERRKDKKSKKGGVKAH